jgi:hypothetical protein
MITTDESGREALQLDAYKSQAVIELSYAFDALDDTDDELRVIGCAARITQSEAGHDYEAATNLAITMLDETRDRIAKTFAGAMRLPVGHNHYGAIYVTELARSILDDPYESVSEARALGHLVIRAYLMAKRERRAVR